MRLLFVFVFLLGLVSCGVNKKSLAKQPNCKDIEGINDCDSHQHKEKFKNYSGLIKCCKNGKVEMFVTFKDGKPDGLIRVWYENGQLEGEGNLKEGKQDGLARSWHENGKLAAESIYKDGIELTYKCYDEDGKVIDCD